MIFNLRFPEGDPQKLTMDLCNSLGELRELLRLPRSDFRLLSDGFFLRDDPRSLRNLGIDATSRPVRRDKRQQQQWEWLVFSACGSPGQKIEKHLAKFRAPIGAPLPFPCSRAVGDVAVGDVAVGDVFVLRVVV